MGVQLTIMGAILSYPNLFTPREYQTGDGKPRYSAKLILPEDYDFTEMLAAGASEQAAVKAPEGCRMPWSQVKEGPYAGRWQVAAYRYHSSQGSPQVVDQGVNPVMDQNLVFAGCIVNANIDVYGYDAGKAKGVSAGLNIIQIVDNSDAVQRLDNSVSASDVFKPIAGAPAPTAAMPGQPAPTAAMPGQPAPTAAMPGQPAPTAAMPGQPAAMPGQPSPAAMPGQPAAMPGQPAAMPGQPSPAAMPWDDDIPL